MVAHVAPVDGLPGPEDLVDEGSRRQRLPGWKHDVVHEAGGRHHPHVPFLQQHDRRPVEWDQVAQLTDERAERLLELERRAKRLGAAVRGVDRVAAPVQLVLQLLGLLDAVVGDGGFGREALDEPTDDEGNHHFDDDLHRDVLPAEPLVEVLVAEPLVPEQHRDARRGEHQPAANPVAESRLDQDEDHDLPDRGGLLVVEPEDEGRDDDEVEDQGGEAEPSERVPVELTPGQEQQHDRPRGEHGCRRPEPHLLAERVRICDDRLEGYERHGSEPDPGKPAFGVDALLVAHAKGSRSRIRANAHSACSRRRSSSPFANGAASAAASAPPTFPSATSAFRRR
jgi:hypothetical protein